MRRLASEARPAAEEHPYDGPIAPYGGVLVDRSVGADEAADLTAAAAVLPAIRLSRRSLGDLFLISNGALSPLTGFMGSAEYSSVVHDMLLASGLPWSIPITLPVTTDEAAGVAPGGQAALYAPDGELAGILDVVERFERDLDAEAARVYGTSETAHPGIAALHAAGPTCLAGPIRYVYPGDISGSPEHHLSPARTRARFDERGWRSVVAFQTRNPIHRAHEYLLKCALEIVDGLLVHPLVGETKSDDIPADVRMDCYKAILEGYFPADRVQLSVLPAAMRYAGPREAIFHAIMRRNYGCTHFIVGRDHAGVGDYYGTYDAQHIFDEIDREALGIQPLPFEHAFWCKLSGQMATAKTSPSTPDQRIFLSGTKVREMLVRGERPPAEFTRPEVADVLMRAYQKDGAGP